jgi:hypothetical protein
MLHTRITLIALAWLLATGPTLAADNWHLARHSDGIQVYTMDVSGSKIIKVKTRVTIATPMQHIQRILDNVPQRKDWVPYLQHSAIIETLDDGSRIEHSIFAAPWPAADRDFTYRMVRGRQDAERQVYTMKSTTTEQMPDQPDIIRAELIDSRYSLRATGAERTEVELIFYADPKGWLPNWIINIIQQVLPYRMLKNLRALATTRYQRPPLPAGQHTTGQLEKYLFSGKKTGALPCGNAPAVSCLAVKLSQQH